MGETGTILVTGGAGYIGSHTIITLLENTKFDIISIDNFCNSNARVFDFIEEITGKRVVNKEVDLCDKQALFDTCMNIEDIIGVIHFAAYKSVPESVEDPYKYYHNNNEALLNIIEFSISKQIPNFIFSSSCSVYGNIDQLPVNENSVLNLPESPYAATKQMGEQILKSYTDKYSWFKVIALRYFNPVGAHLSGLLGEMPINKPTGLLPMITKTALGIFPEMYVYGDDYDTRDGSCIRDYIHVSDLANAHLKALNHLLLKQNKLNYTIINIGTGDGVTVFEAINAFEKITNSKLNYKVVAKRPGDVAAVYSDTTFSESVLNWKAEIAIEQMMDSAWKWELKMQKDQIK